MTRRDVAMYLRLGGVTVGDALLSIVGTGGTSDFRHGQWSMVSSKLQDPTTLRRPDAVVPFLFVTEPVNRFKD